MTGPNFEPSEIFNDDYLWFYEPVLTPDRTRTEVDEILATLQIDGSASILDAPCGHGRLANALAAAGHQVTGVDITPLFIDRARNEATDLGVDVDFHLGDLRELPVDGPFDAVICWFTSFGYFDDIGNRQVLDEFARVLRPGGTLVIETLHHDGLVHHLAPRPTATVAERGDDVMFDMATFDSVSGRVETARTIVRDGATRRSRYSVRLPTVPEFDRWLADAGFVEVSYSDRDGEPLRHDSWRLVVTASR